MKRGMRSRNNAKKTRRQRWLEGMIRVAQRHEQMVPPRILADAARELDRVVLLTQTQWVEQ